MINTQLPSLMNSATLSWATPHGDENIAFIARMSAKKNQERTRELVGLLGSDNVPEDERKDAEAELQKLTAGLILSCIEEGHVSILEMANLCVFIKTTRRIGPQILRHKNHFQEFSTRYAKISEKIEFPEIRLVNVSGLKRDPSEGLLDDPELLEEGDQLLKSCQDYYDKLIDKGAHPESAVFFLPMAAPTYLAMNATIRDLFFYLVARTSPHAQEEHQDIAFSIEKIFAEHYPTVFMAYQWYKQSNV
jgi:flavin-dependent thymidylate synthase